MRYCVLLAVLLASTFAHADLAVIVNVANPTRQMSVQQVADLYLGRTRAFASGEFALILDLPREAPQRERFFARIANMNLQQTNSYLSRLLFTGQMLPPQVQADDRAMIEAVRRNPAAIGYVSAESADASVRVVQTLKK